jgi:cytochrome P450/nitrite reductase/ring-hydroxylating ferredoxin subunit
MEPRHFRTHVPTEPVIERLEAMVPERENPILEVDARRPVEWKRATESAHVADDRPCGISLNGVELVVLRTGRALYAYEGRCPHQGALLAEGELGGGVLMCRNHGWRFDAATGKRLGGPQCLRACPVRDAGGWIWVEVPAGEGAQPSPRGHRSVASLPGPSGLPLLGNLLQMDVGKLPALLEGWASAHGGLYQLRLGPRRAVVLSDRALADAALRARPEAFRRLHTFESVATELGMVGVFTAEGETWRSLRTLTVSALANRHLTGFYPILRTVAQRIHGRWQRSAASGQVLDIADEFKRFSVDVMTWLALDRDVNTVENDDDVVARHLRLIFQIFHRRVVAPFPYWRLIRLPSDRRFERSMSELRSWIETVIAQGRVRLEKEPWRADAPSSFLDALLAVRDQAGQPLSADALFGSALTMLVAGQDTTSTSLSWTVHHVGNNPRVSARLRQELDRVLGDAAVPETVERAQHLTYTAAVMNETLRVSPIVPILYLEAAKDTFLADVLLPRGTAVFVLTRAAVREGQFGAAHEFRPERWLDEERGGLAHDPAAHIPFGSGPRVCPGRALAHLESRVALATLFKSFDVELTGAQPVERYTSLLTPEGLSARLHPRGRK